MYVERFLKIDLLLVGLTGEIRHNLIEYENGRQFKLKFCKS